MSSWLGSVQWGSLPNQISNFAKEVLTEAEEEVQDPVAELKVAKGKIKELEESLEGSKNELERLRKYNEELSDRAETAEYQIAAISQEYRKVILEKDEQIKSLKSQNLRLEEKGNEFLLPHKEPYTSLPKVTSAALLSAEEGLVEVDLHDDYDGPSWTEGMSVQNQEVKRLHDEVVYLKEQCDHWRRQAEGGGEHGEERQEVEALKSEIEGLRRVVKDEAESHQHQITSLQEHHNDILQNLRKTHCQKLEDLQTVIQGLKDELKQTQQTSGLRDSESSSGLEELVRERECLQCDIVSLEQRIKEEELAKEELVGNLTKLQGDTESLTSQISVLSQQLTEKSAETELLKLEYTASEERFRDLTSKLAAMEAENTALKQQNQSLLCDLQTTKSASASSREADRDKLHQLVSQLAILKSNLSAVKESTSQSLSLMSKDISSSASLLSAAAKSNMEAERGRLKVASDKLRDVENQYAQVLVELEGTRIGSLTLSLSGASLAKEGGKEDGGSRRHDLEEKIKELEKQVLLEVSSKERLKEHLARITAEHDTELSELAEERDRLQESCCELEEKLNTSQGPEDSFWKSSEGGWNDWDTEDRTVHTESNDGPVASMQEKASSEKWRKYGEPILKVLSDVLGTPGEPTPEDIASLATMLTDRNAVEMQLKESEKSLDHTKEMVASKDKQLDLMNSQLKECEEKCKAVQVEKEGVHEELSKLRTELENNRAQLDKLSTVLLEKTQDCEHLSEENGRMSAKLDEFLRAKEELVSTTEEEYKQVHQDHRKLLLEVEDKSRALADLRNVVDEKERELTEIRKERMLLEDQQSNTMQVFAEANQKLRERESEAVALKKELESARQGISQLTSIREAKQTLEQEINTLRGLLHQAETRAESHRHKADRLEEKTSELLETLHMREEDIVLLRGENAKREEALRGLTGKDQKIQSELEQKVVLLEEELGQVRSELVKVQTHNAATVSALEENLAQVTSESHSRDNEAMKTQEQLESVTKEKKKLELELSDVQSHNQLLSLKCKKFEEDALQQKEVLAKVQDSKDSSLKVLEAQITALGSERDQLVSTLNEIGKENGMLKEEIATLKDTHQQTVVKNSEDVQRLKRHLLQVDEHYTQEAVKAEEREIELRQKVAHLEEEMSRSTISEQASIHQRDQEVVSLQQQLQVLAQQRDDAVFKLSTAQDEMEQTQHELSNLQMVLEQFQKDHVSEINAALEQSRGNLARVEADKEDMRHEIAELKEQLQGASLSLENASYLENELELREKQYKEVQERVNVLEASLATSQSKIHQLTSQEEDRVDKNLVKNLIRGYLTAPERKKGEILKLIANILGMSDHETSQGTRSRSWLSGWFGGSAPQSPTQEASFTEMFVKFLENESKKTKNSPEPGSQGYVDPRTDPDRPSLATTSLHPMVATNPRPPPTSTVSRETAVQNLPVPTTSTAGSVPPTGSSTTSKTGSASLTTSSSPPTAEVPKVGLSAVGPITLSKPSQPVNLTPTSLQTSLLKNILSN